MQTTTSNHPAPNPDKIAGLAYGLWEQAGRPDGRDQEFWFKAKQRLARAAKPQAASPGQSRPEPSPSAATTAFELKSQPEPEGAAKTASLAATRLALVREHRNAAAVRPLI